MNKLPYFKFWDNTPVVVGITDGITENGDPNIVTTFEGKCCFKEKTRIVRDKDGQDVKSAGVITIMGDIAPDVQVLDGIVEFLGKDRIFKILNAARPKNPDGTVNHTRLELV